RFQVQLEQNGMLELSWDCDNPSGAAGTVYEIFRSDSGYDGPFTYLGNTGVRKFVDAKIPAGVTRVTYKIRAVRSTKVGSCAYFGVSFGGVGIAIARTVPNAPRLAA